MRRGPRRRREGRVRRVAGGGHRAAALDPAAPLVQDPAIRVEKDPLAHERAPGVAVRLGDVDGVGADCVIENDYTFPMVTHFAIEPHAFLAAPDAEGVTIWSADPASLRAAARRGLGAWMARVEGPDHFAGSRGRLRRQGLAEVRAVARVPRAPDGPARSSRADARGDVSAGPTRVCEGPRRGRGSTTPGASCSRTFEADFLIGAYADVGGARGQQGELRGVRTLSNAERARDGARAAVAHDAEHRVSRVRHAAGVLGRRIAAQRRRRCAGDRPASRSGAATLRRRRSLHSR